MRAKRTTPDPMPRPTDLPNLPAFHTHEQRRAFREQVAALPERVHIPALPDEPSTEQVELHRRAVAIDCEQRMQAEAARMATDPKEIARRGALAQIEVRTIDLWIGRLQERRAMLMAHAILDDAR